MKSYYIFLELEVADKWYGLGEESIFACHVIRECGISSMKLSGSYGGKSLYFIRPSLNFVVHVLVNVTSMGPSWGQPSAVTFT